MSTLLSHIFSLSFLSLFSPLPSAESHGPQDGRRSTRPSADPVKCELQSVVVLRALRLQSAVPESSSSDGPQFPTWIRGAAMSGTTPMACRRRCNARLSRHAMLTWAEFPSISMAAHGGVARAPAPRAEQRRCQRCRGAGTVLGRQSRGSVECEHALKRGRGREEREMREEG